MFEHPGSQRQETGQSPDEDTQKDENSTQHTYDSEDSKHVNYKRGSLWTMNSIYNYAFLKVLLNTFIVLVFSVTLYKYLKRMVMLILHTCAQSVDSDTSSFQRIVECLLPIPFTEIMKRFCMPVLWIIAYLKLGNMGSFEFLHPRFDLRPLPQPEPIRYAMKYNMAEIKRSIGWVPLVVFMNYFLVFFWVSGSKIVFGDYDISSWWSYTRLVLIFMGSFAVISLCTNALSKHASNSLYRMSCNMILLFFSGIITSTMNNLTHYLHQKGPALFDIGFRIIPEITGPMAEMSDIILVGYLAIFIFKSIQQDSEIRNKLWADYGRICSIMILSKGFMGWWTLLPGPATHCRPGSLDYSPQSALDIFIFQGTLMGRAYNCGDLIFSGHTGFIMIAMLLSPELFKGRSNKTKAAWTCFSVATFLAFFYFCVAARKHYSVDIISAIWISSTLFSVFRHQWIPSHFLTSEGVTRMSEEIQDSNALESKIIPPVLVDPLLRKPRVIKRNATRSMSIDFNTGIVSVSDNEDNELTRIARRIHRNS